MDNETNIRGYANLLAANKGYMKAIEILEKIIKELQDQQWNK